jgi:hypothetical protein
LALFLLSALVAAGAGAQEVADPSPDDAKHSCIQEVSGYANLSEDMTLAQTRQAAVTNAKRLAVEMARTYIQSQTTVENFVLKQDLVTGSAEGAVTVLEIKDYGVEDNSRYHVWIKAEVVYDLEPAAGPAPASGAAAGPGTDGMNPDAPLTVQIWTPQKVYQQGETITIYLKGNRNFYARIVDMTSAGEIIQLLPNDYRQNNYFEAGKVYQIPDEEDRFSLSVSPPFGQDRIVVYASEVPLGDVQTEAAGNGLRSFKGSPGQLATLSRGIAVKPASQGSPGGAAFFEGRWNVTTEK